MYSYKERRPGTWFAKHLPEWESISMGIGNATQTKITQKHVFVEYFKKKMFSAGGTYAISESFGVWCWLMYKQQGTSIATLESFIPKLLNRKNKQYKYKVGEGMYYATWFKFNGKPASHVLYRDMMDWVAPLGAVMHTLFILNKNKFNEKNMERVVKLMSFSYNKLGKVMIMFSEKKYKLESIPL